MRKLAWSTGSGLALVWCALLSCVPPDPSAGGRPTELSAQVLDDAVVLTWRDNATNEARYVVERSESSATEGFSDVASLSENTSRYRDTAVVQGAVYWYRVSAVFRTGNRATSPTIEVTVDSASAPPAAPTRLSARAASESAIDLTWTDASNDEVGFILERASSDQGPFAEIARPARNATSYQDGELERQTTYFYRLRAYNSAGESQHSNVASATTLAQADLSPPTVPGNVTATATSPSAITVSWDASTDDVAGVKEYRLYLNNLVVKRGPETSAMVTGLASNTMYCFEVDAVDNVDKASARSTQACATTPQQGQVPNTPGSVTAQTVAFNQINLTWTDTSNNEQGFRIERAQGTMGTFTQIGQVGANVTTFQSTGLRHSTVYCYRVKAFNASGESDYSMPTQNSCNATRELPPNPPSGLDGGVLNISAGNYNIVRLTWVDNSNDPNDGGSENGFSILQSTQGPDGGFQAVQQTGANTRQFDRTLLNPNTTYYFRVAAFTQNYTSAPSNAVSVLTPPAPNAPTALDAGALAVAQPDGGRQVDLTWLDNSTDEVGFRVETATAANGPYTTVRGADGGFLTVPADTTAYTVGGLMPNVLYFFRVRAAGANAWHSTAAQTSARTAP